MARQQFWQPQGKWMIGGAVGLALAIAAVGFWHVAQLHASKGSKETEASTALAKKNTGITALGRIEPQGEVIKVGGPNGERILKLLVKEGQRVKSGQTLALLESYPERLAERDLATSRLKEAQALAKSEEAVGNAQILEAKTRQAQVTQPITEQMRAQVATIERLKIERQRAIDDYERFAQLAAGGAASQKELYDRGIAVQSRTQELNNAIASLKQLRQQRQTDLDNAITQLQMAEASMVRSQVQAQVNSTAGNLELAKARLERAVIKAPQDGQVIEILIKEGETISFSGGQGTGGESTILEMGNTRQMVVVAEVYETDIGQVKVGQSASITSPVIEGKLLGQVQKVGLQIGKKDVLDTDPTADTDARVVEVEIGLANGFPVAQLTNLQVDVVIHPEGDRDG